MSRIKICGLTRSEDISAVNQALPDYIGFVFALSRRQIDEEQARTLKSMLDERILAVGVFVNADLEQIARLCQSGLLDMVQMHGDEDAAYIAALRKRIYVPIIKAVRVQNTAQIQSAQELDCDFLLLDTYTKGCAGGSGTRFDWSLIPPMQKPFFLAGGIDIGMLAAALAQKPFAVDISSGAETDGYKDRHKIEALVRTVRSVT